MAGLRGPGNEQIPFKIQWFLAFLMIFLPPSRPASPLGSSFDLVLVIPQDGPREFPSWFPLYRILVMGREGVETPPVFFQTSQFLFQTSWKSWIPLQFSFFRQVGPDASFLSDMLLYFGE